MERQRKEMLRVSWLRAPDGIRCITWMGPRNWGPHKSPAKRVLWGEDEQGSERNFRHQAEMELSGLCEDEGSGGAGA